MKNIVLQCVALVGFCLGITFASVALGAAPQKIGAKFHCGDHWQRVDVEFSHKTMSASITFSGDGTSLRRITEAKISELTDDRIVFIFQDDFGGSLRLEKYEFSDGSSSDLGYLTEQYHANEVSLGNCY